MASAAHAGLTLDDLSIGTLVGGDSVMGNTAGSSDDMNGDAIMTGGSWNGGDDVYTLLWGGGDLVLDLLFAMPAPDGNDGDLDLFLFDNNLSGGPGELAQALSLDANEQIEMLGLAAGTYYVSVDGWTGDTNAYTLNVSIPTPSSMALLGLGGLVVGRRRR